MREFELVQLAKEGNLKAYEVLYRSCVAQIKALCRRMSGDESMAEDLTQEAFVLAWRKLASFKEDSSFSTWMYRVASNVTIDYLRSRKHWHFTDFSVLEDQEMPEKMSKACAIDLEKAIKLLPPQARTVLILHTYLGYQHNEIADRTGLAVGTCKAHLHRAKGLLKQVLVDE